MTLNSRGMSKILLRTGILDCKESAHQAHTAVYKTDRRKLTMNGPVIQGSNEKGQMD